MFLTRLVNDVLHGACRADEYMMVKRFQKLVGLRWHLEWVFSRTSDYLNYVDTQRDRAEHIRTNHIIFVLDDPERALQVSQSPRTLEYVSSPS